jgi:DNA-directed RNA polymerase subunit L
MELKTLKKTKNELELEITDENETILNPITHVLTEHEDIEYAACISDHPLSNKRRLFIRVKKGNPDEHLKKAVKQLEDEVKKFGKYFEDTPKSKPKSKK